ncbi:type II restriction endonuclease [Hyphomonas pacifica]|uniref:Type II restriction endonuclease n=1 Tax=Hyphomonas pacifica TaxID=1280941 RepID=A0A062TW84_9PROT|nr:type II restriction endonuclease [Hyphomonas pacifica]KCZ48337.1 hypothetical protein HY2_03810 [Hyphomonas pacifica]RAN31649.1 hypothetical protein HY3_03505 [Hyphomonas pacifica]
MELDDWVDSVSGPSFVWYIKRLSGNDTQLTGGHQAGPYVPRDLAFHLMPHFEDLTRKNPRGVVELQMFPGGYTTSSNIIYYNNKFHDNHSSGRNETRLTGLGGRENPLLDPENTGALSVFAFKLGAPVQCQVWICGQREEEVFLEDILGPVEPGESIVWDPGNRSRVFAKENKSATCTLSSGDIPEAWLEKFPSGMEIIQRAISLRPDKNKSIDDRLLRRRECEFEIFRSVERAFFTPRLQRGFSDLEAFLAMAQTILQSRKSRSGKSLEYHAKSIFDEVGLREGVDYEYNPKIEGNKKPDFLFPTSAQYRDLSYPSEGLTVLAAKTTCKDRWRQILNEADRVSTKYLLTLQEGVSLNQFSEMSSSGVKLVVPKKLHSKYPESIQREILSLEGFLSRLPSSRKS